MQNQQYVQVDTFENAVRKLKNNEYRVSDQIELGKWHVLLLRGPFSFSGCVSLFACICIEPKTLYHPPHMDIVPYKARSMSM